MRKYSRQFDITDVSILSNIHITMSSKSVLRGWGGEKGAVPSLELRAFQI